MICPVVSSSSPVNTSRILSIAPQNDKVYLNLTWGLWSSYAVMVRCLPGMGSVSAADTLPRCPACAPSERRWVLGGPCHATSSATCPVGEAYHCHAPMSEIHMQYNCHCAYNTAEYLYTCPYLTEAEMLRPIMMSAIHILSSHETMK